MEALTVNDIPIPALIVSVKGIIICINSAAEELLGYEKDELVGKHVNNLVPEQYREVHTKFMDTYYLDPVTKPLGVGRDLQALCKDGTVIDVEIGLYPFKRHIIVILVNILNRKLKAIHTEIESLEKNIEKLKTTWEDLTCLEYPF